MKVTIKNHILMNKGSLEVFGASLKTYGNSPETSCNYLDNAPEPTAARQSKMTK
jgi:hypothetical protein